MQLKNRVSKKNLWAGVQFSYKLCSWYCSHQKLCKWDANCWL